MNSCAHKPPAWLIWMMWLVLPISAVEYRQNWDRLPGRMAVHFNADWQPNGYTSREGAFDLGMGIMVAMLVMFTVGAFAARTLKPSAAWPLLAVFYIVLGLLWYSNHAIIEYNLKSRPVQSEVREGPTMRRGARDLMVET